MVALAGATGSGKSSTFNALVGQEVAATGVRRPTTSTTQAAVFPRRALRPDAADLFRGWASTSTSSSTTGPWTGWSCWTCPITTRRGSPIAEVDRLVQVVDVFVWVVDPQKYADAALHHDYLRRFAGHAAVTTVVLNQIDTLPPERRAAALDDLAAILAADGLPVAHAGVVAR